MVRVHALTLVYSLMGSSNQLLFDGRKRSSGNDVVENDTTPQHGTVLKWLWDLQVAKQ